MDIHNLVHMANRIGEFFAAMPDRDEARNGIAEHLRKFWEPRMRLRILDHADRGTAPTLSELVREALTQQRAQLVPVPRTGAPQVREPGADLAR